MEAMYYPVSCKSYKAYKGLLTPGLFLSFEFCNILQEKVAHKQLSYRRGNAKLWHVENIAVFAFNRGENAFLPINTKVFGRHLCAENSLNTNGSLCI